MKEKMSTSGPTSTHRTRRTPSSYSLNRRSWPAFFKDKEKYDQLSETLSGYTTSGLPSMPDLMAIGQTQVDEAIFHLESHWSCLVDNASSLTKRQHDHQEAIWELLQTEVQYLCSIRVIADVFMCVVLNLQQDLLLNEIETEKMFSNILDIINANTHFWTEFAMNAVKESRQSRRPLNASLLKDGFKKFSEIFKPYTKYCLEQKPCLDYMKLVEQDNELFKTFVVWAEAQPQCNRLKLTDLLVKPMQRLTKYSLLLQAILRKTDDERQRRDLLEMISQVDNFVAHVNVSLRLKHDRERLATIISKIETYEAVEAPNDECKEIIQEYSTPPDLWKPMPHCGPNVPRALVMQSSLKMKDAQTRVDVECLLFTDLLLICKANKRLDKYRIIKPPLRVDRIVVQELRDKCSFLLIHLNEYKVPVWAVTFHADVGSTKCWVDYIKKAQDLYTEAKAASKILLNHQKPTKSAINEKATGDEELIKILDKPQIPRPRSQVQSESDQATSDREVSPAATVTPQKSGESAEDANDTDHKSIHPSRSLPSISPVAVITIESDDDDEGDKEAAASSPVKNLQSKSKANKDNSRRNSRMERRYHTADSIQDLDRKNRDPAIYKRLSWNVGSTELHIQKLEMKATSSDSLRSLHSSSGVSSTCSIHHTLDGEILSEDASEGELSGHGNAITAAFRDLTIFDSKGDAISAMNDSAIESSDNRTSGSFSDISASTSLSGTVTMSDKDIGVNSCDSDESNITVNCTDNSAVDTSCDRLNGSYSDTMRDAINTKSPDSRGPSSKSTSDITMLLNNISFTEVKDGISSVELPKVKDKKRLSYAQRQKMKQLLLTTDMEASEV